MLFKERHIPLIRSGEKTATRREWADGYARPTIGSVQMAVTELFTPDEECDCYIRIVDVFEQPLGAMTFLDARREGDYPSVDEFREAYVEIYGDWDPERVVDVVHFRYVGRKRPAAEVQEVPSA